ncbi:hypothetical protein YC2023_107602 [Brassica napus]
MIIFYLGYYWRRRYLLFQNLQWVAEELIVDGILERWKKIKPVIMEARKNLFFSVCKK